MTVRITGGAIEQASTVVRNVAVTALVIYMGILLHEEVPLLNEDGGAVADFARAQKIPVQKLIANWTAPAIIASQMLANERDAQAAQLKSIQTLTVQMTTLTTQGNADMVKLGELIDSMKSIAPAITTQITRVGDDIHISLVATGAMVDAVTKDLNDPSIKLSLVQIAQITATLRDAAAKGDRIMLDVEKVADHYEIKLDSPATLGQKFKAGALFAARILGDFIKF
jgi:hypothetical protein